MNTIGFHRGYTGHEMLGEFGIINMNGRLYDPLLGRFLSPDRYVQSPDNSQNFNRYSYCLNNPLKYTDPSGEIFGIDDFLFFSVASGMMMGAMTAKMNGGSMLKGAILGMNINLLNHGWITNAQEENVYMLDGVVANGRMGHLHEIHLE